MPRLCRHLAYPLLVCCLVPAALACSPDASRACSVHADCASGLCGADGQCAVAGASDGKGFDVSLPRGDGRAAADVGARPSEDGAALADAASTGMDATVPADTIPAQDGDAPGVCKANQDGTITRTEVPVAVGLKALYKVAQGVEVDTHGATQTDGTRAWDLTSFTGDHLFVVETIPLAGTWYENKFDDPTYAVRLNDRTNLIAIVRATDDALLMVGVVSPDDGLLRTELTYDPPATLMQFPLTQGGAWTSHSTVTGTAQGLIVYYYEDYSGSVDARGVVKTPFGAFPVLRAKVKVKQVVGLLTHIYRSVIFISECFGTVGAIDSELDETQEEFTKAAEVRRLSP